MESQDMISAKDIKELSRKQRHDFMNTLQLIYGYLQLERKEDAIKQIKKATNMSQYISQLYKISVIDLCLDLEKKMMAMTNLGINLDIKVETPYEGEYREIENSMEIIGTFKEILSSILNSDIEKLQSEKIHNRVKIIERENNIEISFFKNSCFCDEKIKMIKSDYKEVETTDNQIVITFNYKGLKNIKIKDSIYSKIYSNNI